jgi:hypothetical protein
MWFAHGIANAALSPAPRCATSAIILLNTRPAKREPFGCGRIRKSVLDLARSVREKLLGRRRHNRHVTRRYFFLIYRKLNNSGVAVFRVQRPRIQMSAASKLSVLTKSYFHIKSIITTRGLRYSIQIIVFFSSPCSVRTSKGRPFLSRVSCVSVVIFYARVIALG